MTARLIACAALLVAACGHAPGPQSGSPPTDPVEDVAPAELFERGLALARRGDMIRAEQYLSAARQQGHPEREVIPALLRVCVATSRFRMALQYSEPYLQRHPDDWSLRYLVASILLGLGDNDRARAELERVVSTVPTQADPHYLLAVVLRDNAGDSTAARPHFEKYLELAPGGGRASEVRDYLEHGTVAPTVRPAPEEIQWTPGPSPEASP